MRSLVLLHEGAPMRTSITAEAIKRTILDWPDDDADLWEVWEVTNDDSHAPSLNITEQFALTWSLAFGFGDGIEPSEYLAPFPAFVHEAARASSSPNGMRRSSICRTRSEGKSHEHRERLGRAVAPFGEAARSRFV